MLDERTEKSLAFGDSKIRRSHHSQVIGCNHVRKLTGRWEIIDRGVLDIAMLLTSCESSGRINRGLARSTDGTKIVFNMSESYMIEAAAK